MTTTTSLRTFANERGSFHYGFKAPRAFRVHLAGIAGDSIIVEARSAVEATYIATQQGHDVTWTAVAR